MKLDNIGRAEVLKADTGQPDRTVTSSQADRPTKVEFWSSAEYTFFMRGIIGELCSQRYDTEHCFGISDRSYRNAMSFFARLLLRVRMYVLYPMQLSASVLRRGNCIAIVNTNTFYAPLLASLVGHQTQVVHLVYDLFPDALEYSGVIRRHSIVSRLLSKVTRATFSRSAANVFLGEQLLQHAVQRYGDIPNARIIPVGADNIPYRDMAVEIHDHPTLLYCGNMGKLHDTSTILNLWQSYSKSKGLASARWVFHASGSSYLRLQRDVLKRLRSCPSNVSFRQPLADSEWVETMKSADVALVTMSLGAEKVIMPSKVYSAMMAGQAILAICPRESDLSEVVEKHACGWVVKPGDVDGLRDVVRTVVTKRDLLLEKRKNAYRAGHEHYSVEVVAKQWQKLFEELTSAK